MTQHLASMTVGQKIDIRGPKGTMQYSRSLAKQVGMIAGGTGITPMYQLIRAICEDDSDNTQISLIYANNTEGDILLREEFEGFSVRAAAYDQRDDQELSWVGIQGARRDVKVNRSSLLVLVVAMMSEDIHRPDGVRERVRGLASEDGLHEGRGEHTALVRGEAADDGGLVS